MPESEDPTEIETQLLLVRHGESNVTVDHILGGELTDTGLSGLGRRQSEALRDRLAADGVSVDAVVSSTLPRALETAEIVAPALGVAEIEKERELVERRPGEADGMHFTDYLERYGNGIWDDPYMELSPGGESAAAFQHRTVIALSETLIRHSGRRVMVFCHGGVIDVAFREFLDVPRYSGFDLWTLNTSLTEFLHISTGTAHRWRLIRYNDAAHLVGLPPKTPND